MGFKGFANNPRWSPDGRTIAFTRFYAHYDVHLVLRSAAGGAELDLGGVCEGQPTWGPDSRFVIASRRDQTLECRPTLYSALSGQTIRQLAQNGSCPSLSPDGRSLAYADGEELTVLRFTADYPGSRFPSHPHRGVGKATGDGGSRRLGRRAACANLGRIGEVGKRGLGADTGEGAAGGAPAGSRPGALPRGPGRSTVEDRTYAPRLDAVISGWI